MILKLMLFSSCTILVSTNTRFPVLSAQTYPFYQQNGYMYPSNNQPNDITPYLQEMMVQNQSPPLNLSPSIKQILLNQILSNPSVNTIFDTNHRGYGANYEFLNNQITPNLASNYFVGHTEYLNNHPSDLNKANKVTDIKSKGKSKDSKKRRSSKSRRKHNSSKKNENNFSNNVTATVSNTQYVDKETNQKSRKNSRKNTTESSSPVNDTKKKENEGNNNARTRRRKNKDYSENSNSPIDEENKNAENTKPRRRHTKKKAGKVKTEKIILEQQKIPDKEAKEIREGLNLAYLNEGIVEEIRVPRNPKHEGNDILKSLSIMPEDYANNFFTGLPQMNNPLMSNFFANYENIYQSMQTNKGENDDKRGKKRRKTKRSKRKNRRHGKRNRTSTEETTTLSNSNILRVGPKIDIVTTERTVYINEITQTNIDSTPNPEEFESFNKTPSTEKKIMIVLDNDEISNRYHENKPQDSEPYRDTNYLYNGYIDDYYPLFDDNAAYNANNNEVYIKKLDDNKFYYATDKPKTEFENISRFEDYDFPERIIKDNEENKQFDQIENYGVRTAFKNNYEQKIEEEIKFRSPPFLELPDFQTRQVEKSEIRPEPYYYFDGYTDSKQRFVGDKTYSNSKTPHYVGSKHNVIIDQPKDKLQKDVETVFARTKVVKYGPIFSSEEDSSYAGTSNHAWTDDSYLKDGSTTYVMAKSLDYPDVFW